jgi:hypothetical protein
MASDYLQIKRKHQVHGKICINGKYCNVRNHRMPVIRRHVYPDIDDILNAYFLGDTFLDVETDKLPGLLVIRAADQFMKPRAVVRVSEVDKLPDPGKKTVEKGLAQVVSSGDQVEIAISVHSEIGPKADIISVGFEE